MNTQEKAEFGSRAAFLLDEPIKHSSEDRLNLTSYVDVMERIIRSGKTPLNIGLFGRWGVGKTSILNLLKERVTEVDFLKDRFDFFSIDAWQLSKESLRQQLLIDLNKHYGERAFTEEEIEDSLFNIKELGFEEEIKESVLQRLRNILRVLRRHKHYPGIFLGILICGIVFRPYLGQYFDIVYSNLDLVVTSFLAPVILAIIEQISATAKIVRLSAKRIIPRVEYPHQFEKMFRKILRGRGDKTLIIAIDNLDRCEDEVVVGMLATIKNFMNVPGCIFIMACDDEAIERHLLSKKGAGFRQKDAREFLRKFFHAPVKISPFLEEDLENFMDRMIRELGVNFGEEVKEVLMSATTKNPRRVKQFLNSLLSAHYLAERNEHLGSIRKGTVTGNTGFLAKITVIKDEWPEFYKVLEQQEDILEYIEEYFKGEKVEGVNSEDIEQYLRKNEGLEWFLRTTRTIETPDISPFLKMSQESYERTLPEHERFIKRVEFGDIPYVFKTLSKLDEISKTNYFREILKTIDNDMKRKRFNYAFNALNVSCETFSEVPLEVRPEFVQRFEKYAPCWQIKQQLGKFTPAKFFILLKEMRETDRETVLLHYCDFLVLDEKLNQELVDLFISERNILTGQVIDRVNAAIVEFLEKDEEYTLGILYNKFISDPEVKRTMINQRTLSAIVEKIDNTASGINSKRVETYFDLKDMASRDNKTLFIRKMLSIISEKKATSIDSNMQFALEKLTKLKAADVPRDVIDDLYDVVVEVGANMSNDSHKLQFFKLVLENFGRLGQQRKDAFIEHNVKPLVAKGNEQIVTEIVDTSSRNKVPLLEYTEVMNTLMQRVGTNLPVQRFIDYLMVESSMTKKEQVGGMLIKMIQSNNNSLISPALEGFQRNFNHFPPEVNDEVSKACLDAGKGKPPQQMKIFFDPIVVAFEGCSDTFRSVFVDQVLTQMKTDNPKFRETGATYYEKVSSHVTEHKRRYALGQLISKLGSIQEQIDVSAKPLIDTIINGQSLLDENDVIRFIDILSGQLVSTKSEETQIVGLEGIRRLEKLYRRSNPVLRAIFDLSKTSGDKVKELCKDVLLVFKDRYKGPGGFWKEAAKTLSLGNAASAEKSEMTNPT